MDRKIIWTESAWRDLEEAAEYIAKDSQHYAAAFPVCSFPSIPPERDGALTKGYR